MRSLWVSLLLLILLITGCASGGAETDPAILGQIEQLNLKAGMTRAEITERLGTPDDVYEKDHVISYALHEQHGRVLTKLPKGTSNTLQLMLLFSPDWRLERVSVVRRDY